jgi:hypothetical protein
LNPRARRDISHKSVDVFMGRLFPVVYVINDTGRAA